MLVVSHDPLLMLMAQHRVVMKNGGMDKLYQTSPEEKILEDFNESTKRSPCCVMN